MSDYIEHEAKEGERFDQLAYRYYGDANRTGIIIEANRALFAPEQPLPAILSHGLKLRVPVVEEAVSEDDLPPWKRGQSAGTRT
jgi:phage tail protein X